MERLLHYVWKYKLYAATPLITTEGRPVLVIDPGMQNTDAGPDFFNATNAPDCSGKYSPQYRLAALPGGGSSVPRSHNRDRSFAYSLLDGSLAKRAAGTENT